jgi:hypothetical protein
MAIARDEERRADAANDDPPDVGLGRAPDNRGVSAGEDDPRADGGIAAGGSD